MADEIKVQPIPPEPFPNGKVEMHADGGGATLYRTMSREELAAMLARYNAERDDA